MSERKYPQIGDVSIQSTTHWNIRREVVGYNGTGGAWIKQQFCWKDGKVCRESTISLNPTDTIEVMGRK